MADKPREPDLMSNAAGLARLGPCPNCRRRMFDDDGTCPHCGYTLNSDEVIKLKEYVKAYRKKGFLLGLICAPLIFLVLYGIALYIQK